MLPSSHNIFPDFSWVFDKSCQLLLHSIQKETRFVGGAVRNTLQGLPSEDIDLATLSTPEEVMQDLQRANITVIPTGLAHGTITAILHGKSYEITTLRTDHETNGRHAKVQFTSSWVLDAQRRDFTMNALYVDRNGNLYDPLGQGVTDACNKYVRFIGNPKERLEEDYLRLLRFFRFCAFYGSQWDKNSLQACIEAKDNLKNLSKERITKEILRLCSSENPWPVLEVMIKNGIFHIIFNHHHDKMDKNFSIDFLNTIENKIFHQKNNFQHKNGSNLQINHCSTEKKKIENYSIFTTCKKEKNFFLSLGRLFFLSLFFPEGNFSEYFLLFSREEKKFWTFLQRYYKNTLFTTIEVEKQWLLHCQCYAYDFGIKETLWGTFMMILVYEFLNRNSIYYFELFNILKNNHEKNQEKFINLLFFLEKSSWPIFPLNGQDIMNILHIKPGPLLGEYIQKIRHYWILNEFPSKDCLLQYCQSIL